MEFLIGAFHVGLIWILCRSWYRIGAMDARRHLRSGENNAAGRYLANLDEGIRMDIATEIMNQRALKGDS